ncbi:IS21-like element helper ATPase IstB [Chitinophaga sp. LS1]|nr:IS21-like element helper ATPase IstB [Chitinophaga sp. LS1]WPV64296.1 IS21-like element helper ATPase IstB [Chitinophaga sp. LS1]WPV66702.1 IS21-like element helper ATPase IstB [Chitinophaga sp. LS1]WPV67787.1 IS21-like element helper ATPase IstB [Chitinophaga sp. LS1]WPV68263.1 IS21-like element helper ATPase IstB [Chitinophaga sp. LS1]
MEKKQTIKQYCHQFRLGGIYNQIDQLVSAAEAAGIGYLEYTVNLLKTEAVHRDYNDTQKRLKTAQLPRSSDLNLFQCKNDSGLSKARLNQLRELNWLDQVYNILLTGPSGTGKSMLAAGLCADAVQKGYKAYFRDMEGLINMFKMKDFSASAKIEYKRLSKAHLIVIDDLMSFPIEKNHAVSFFNFFNSTYEKTAFIITTNKNPAEWATMLNDEVLATALLDRLLFQCEVINLTGKSFRLENRKTIFELTNK